jgi:hypothetical protein
VGAKTQLMIVAVAFAQRSWAINTDGLLVHSFYRGQSVNGPSPTNGKNQQQKI